MKKILLFALGMCAWLGANAQETTTSGEDRLKPNKVSEMQVYYAGKFESAANLGLNIRHSYLELGGGFQIAGEGSGWNINLGGAYRYNFSKNIFVEGAAGLNYTHSSIETRVATGTYTRPVGSLGNKEFTKYENKKYSSNGVGCYITPRIGVTADNGWGVYAGYELSFMKFKFDNIGDRGYWKLGILIPL